MLPRADSKSPCTQRERLGCAEGSMRSSFGKTQGNRLGLVLGTGMDRDIHPATTVTITDWSSLDASSSETGLICERDWRAQVWAWFLWPCALLSEDGLPLEMNGLERARCADENGRRRPRETGTWRNCGACELQWTSCTFARVSPCERGRKANLDVWRRTECCAGYARDRARVESACA